MNLITYKAKVLEQFEYSPNGWKGLKVGVFRVQDEEEEQIGEYERNHPALYTTFFHFSKNGRDYALYSPHYTVTRVLELPSCKDIGGEEINAFGFCPIEFYVPSYIDYEFTSTIDNRVSKLRKNQPKIEDLSSQTFDHTNRDLNGRTSEFQNTYKPVTSLLFYEFGFVAGCIWGDDTSWKIQYFDLSEADKGIIKRDERFGYIELPDRVHLEQAIVLHYGHKYEESKEGDDTHHISIAVQRDYHLITGKVEEIDL